jgi:hypothetical protein
MIEWTMRFRHSEYARCQEICHQSRGGTHSVCGLKMGALQARLACLRYARGFPLLSAIRRRPDSLSSDPASPTIWGAGRAPGVPTESHDGSLWVHVSNRETDWTFKTEEVGFFHLHEGHRNDFGKGTAGVFLLECRSRLAHRITFRSTASRTTWRWFGRDLRQRE